MCNKLLTYFIHCLLFVQSVSHKRAKYLNYSNQNTYLPFLQKVGKIPKNATIQQFCKWFINSENSVYPIIDIIF